MTGDTDPGPEEELDGIQPMVAGMEPDQEVQEWLEEEEAKRRAKEAAEGKGVKGVVYDPGTVEPGRWTKTIAIIVVLAVILAPVLYMVVIPRANAELVIQYHEGLIGGITVDARIENHGTRAMNAVSLTIQVQNSTDAKMADPTIFKGVVGAHAEAPLDAVAFGGDQWDTYHIFVEWSFDCAGRTFQGSGHYVTEGEAMNIWFIEDLTP